MIIRRNGTNMKLFGARRHGRHLHKNVGSGISDSVVDNSNKSNSKKDRNGKGVKRWIKI